MQTLYTSTHTTTFILHNNQETYSYLDVLLATALKLCFSFLLLRLLSMLGDFPPGAAAAISSSELIDPTIPSVPLSSLIVDIEDAGPRNCALDSGILE